MITAAGLARRYGGRLRSDGVNWDFDCPLCTYRASVRDNEDGGWPLVHCHAECSYLDYVEFGLFDDDDDDVRLETSSFVGSKTASEAPRIEDALRIYNNFGSAVGTLAEVYVQATRRISIPLPSILRYGMHRHRGRDWPTMAVPLSAVEGQQTGTQLLFLGPEGRKADLPKKHQRRSYGIIKGSAVRLAEYDPQRELGVAEGVESALAVTQIFDVPTWATCGAGLLKSIQLPPEVRRVLIAADRDDSGIGQRNSWLLYQRLRSEGRAVDIVLPPLGTDDFSTLLMQQRGA
jgi:putative DNA primase/helicase